ncbi:MAG: pirin family protein [Chitinophagaceae bacterium]
MATGAKIFLSDQRGCNELNWFRSYNMFNFGHYVHPHKMPFGDLYVLNDDTLAGGKILTMELESASAVLLIPIVGAVQYKDDYGNDALVEAGEAVVTKLDAGKKISFINPYETELVNFLQIWIRVPSGEHFGRMQNFLFNLDAHLNAMLPLFSEGCPHSEKSFIGKFNGRAEAEMILSDKMNGFFVFVIEGAFEVEGRLLHARDGLALWNTPKIEMEALSNDAILLVVEVAGAVLH